MKRTIKTIFCAAAAVLAAVSCQKSTEPVQTAEEGKGTIEVRVNGLMGEYNQIDATKAELVNTIRVSWKGGETVYVYDGSKCIGSLVASLEGDEDRYAVLSTDGGEHQIETPAQGTKILTLVYSPLLTEKQEASHDLFISLEAQSGEKAPFVAYATLEYKDETTITGTVVPFKFATSVIKVNCTGLKAKTAITSATLSNVNTACKLTLSGSAAPTVSGDVNGTITRTGSETCSADQVNGEGEAVFQIAVPVLYDASGARVLTVAQGSDKVKDKKFTTNSLVAATSVNTVCQLVGLPAGALKGEFTVSNDGGTTTTQIHFSQGNLYAKKESGVWKWHFYDEQYKYNSLSTGSSRTATVNDTEIDLFTWGYDNTSTNTSYSLNPVNNNGISGHTTDGDKQFSASEDWGYVFEGESSVWRTLSTAEWKYLINKDNDENIRKGKYKYGVTVCDKANCLVLAPDGWDLSINPLQSSYGTTSSESNPMTWEQAEAAGLVCLPAAGFRYGYNVNDVGGGGNYWSSTANGSNGAYDVSFFSGNVGPGSPVSRGGGYSVRLITESK